MAKVPEANRLPVSINMEGNAMTSNLEEIYGRYREADFMGRLHIYLQFPELRDDFLEIDQKGDSDHVGSDSTRSKPAVKC
jgi:hypothetical protein